MLDNDKQFLYNQLVKLGDMMGDGLHHEPDGKWIEKEYKKILKQLGLLKPQSTENIDKFMIERCNKEKCKCGGVLKQVRKGSFIAKCIICGDKYRLGQRKK